jgi:hypothetical protein
MLVTREQIKMRIVRMPPQSGFEEEEYYWQYLYSQIWALYFSILIGLGPRFVGNNWLACAFPLE